MNLQLFIDDVEIDLPENAEDIPLALTFSQADLKNPQKRVRNLSKAVKLPGTTNNCAFFDSAYDIHLTDKDGSGLGFNFDPSIRHAVRLKRKGAEIFKGGLVLDSVDVLGSHKEFNVTMHSAFTDTMQRLGDITIAELDWSDYDHELNITNIADSWDTSVIVNGTPTSNFTGGLPDGFGYLYPYIDYGIASNPLFLKTNEIYAHVYCKEVLEKCFALAGQTIDSDFKDSALFKRFVFGHGGGEQTTIASAEQTARRSHYTADGSRSEVLSPSGLFGFPPKFDYHHQKATNFGDNAYIATTLDVDSYSQFNTPEAELVVANKGSYNLSLACTLDFDYTLGGGVWEFRSKVKLVVAKNFAPLTKQEFTIFDTATGTETLNFSLSQKLDCEAGDVITVYLTYDTFGTFSSAGQTLTVAWDLNNTFDYDFTALNNTVVDGDTIELSRSLPNMKCADFVRDMIIMFNLYFDEPDENDVVKMEPFDDFYFETDDTDNWMQKIDTGAVINIQPASTIEGKVYSFRWAEDRDYYKRRYFEDQGMDYGDFDYNVPSTYKVGEKVYKLAIAQSVPVQLEGTDIIIPRILELDETTEVTKPHKGKPRMYIYNGLISSDPWNLINSDTLIGTGFNEYPQVHHLNSLSSPTFDLNFGKPEYVFYAAASYTTNNLFYLHHAQLIRELTGRDSKIMNLMVKLTEADLYKGFLRRLVNINGSLWRKNIIKDFRANEEVYTKVELIRIVQSKSRSTYAVPVPQLPAPPITNDETISADQKAQGLVDTYYGDTGSADVTIDLDSRYYRDGKTFTFFKLEQANNFIIDAGTDTINGASTYTLSQQYDSITVKMDADGNYWII